MLLFDSNSSSIVGDRSILSVDTRFDSAVISFSEYLLIVSVFFTAALFETVDVLAVADDNFDDFEDDDFTGIFELEADDDDRFADDPFPE